MASPIFTSAADTVDLNAFDLDALEAEGVVTNDALDGNDVVKLSETQNLGEIFFANTGRDTVTGSGAADNISGGPGTDLIYGLGGNDYLSGGNDVDRLFGGNDNDLVYGFADRDYLHGDIGADVLYSGDGGDFVYGGDDGDELYAGADRDFLYGEAGNDGLFGSDGNDELRGGEGNDRLLGQNNNDLVIGNQGSDTLSGNKGLDIFAFSGADLDGSVDRIIDFATGQDKVRLVDVLDRGGNTIDSFADLDTSGDGELDGSDANVTVVGGFDPYLDLGLAGGSLRLSMVNKLIAADFEFGGTA